jgi:hypothetical protein
LFPKYRNLLWNLVSSTLYRPFCWKSASKLYSW